MWMNAFLLATALPAGVAFDPVPLTVIEARIDDPRAAQFTLVEGVDRVQEPVRLGLPLPAELAVCGTDELGISGTAVRQFRVLARWPGAECNGQGGVQWVLVDAQASLSAGAVHQSLALVPGSGNGGGPDLATQGPTTISVDTGAATFHVRRQNFNGIDRIVFDGSEALIAGASDLVLSAGGLEWRTSLDPDVDVVVEENGPLRAAVRAQGAFVGTNGQRWLDFTLRLHFFRGSAQARGFLTVRNASAAFTDNRAFDDLRMMLATTFGAGTAEAGLHGGSMQRALMANESLSLFHGENLWPAFRDYDFEGAGPQPDQKWPTGISGYSLDLDGVELASGDRSQFIELLYGRLQSTELAVTVGTRFGAALWPQGWTISGDGRISVDLFPPGNDRPYVARFTGHVTREFMIDVAEPADSAADAMRRFQYPLVGKASDPEWYNASGALWEPLVSFQQQAQHYQDQGYPPSVFDYPDTWNPAVTRPLGLNGLDKYGIVRHFYWGSGGGDNQYDQAKVMLHNFLRGDGAVAAAFYAIADQKLGYNADLAVSHSDDYDGEEDRPNFGNALPPSFADAVPSAKVIFEADHLHAYGLPLYYLLSGDERIRDASLDHAEYLHHAYYTNDLYGARPIGWMLFNLVDAYRLGGDARHRDRAWEIVEQTIAPEAQLGVAGGTDYRRGFFTMGITQGERFTNTFVHGNILARAYAYLLEFGDPTPAQRDLMLDLLEGIVRFVHVEHWFEFGPGQNDFGYSYWQDVDSAPADPRLDPDGDWQQGWREAWHTQIHGHLLTGDPEFLRQAGLMQGKLQQWSSSEFVDWPDRQALEVLMMHPERYERWIDLDLQVVDQGAGNYLLSWTVPAGAREIRVKHASRPIVPWLGFDRATRQYSFDPTQFVAFFAAENADGEPAPGIAGQLQSWQVGGIGTNREFAAKVLVGIIDSRVFANGFE